MADAVSCATEDAGSNGVIPLIGVTNDGVTNDGVTSDGVIEAWRATVGAENEIAVDGFWDGGMCDVTAT